LSEEKISSSVGRRGVLKFAVTAIVAGVVAGVGGYFSGVAAVPPPKTITETVTETAAAATVTVTAPAKTITETTTVTVTPTPVGPPIKIAVLAPVTGPPARAGKAMANAAEMAEADINAAGGLLGRPVDIIVYDTEDKPETGRLVAERAILADKVVAIAGIFRSEISMIVAEVVADHKIPLVVGTAQTPKLTKLVADNYDRYKYVFRSTTTAVVLGNVLTDFIMDYLAPKYGVKKIGFLQEDVLWARGLVAAETKRLTERGFEVKTWVVPLGVTDIPEMKMMEEWGADVIFPVFSSDNGYLVSRLYTEQKINAFLIGVNNPIASLEAWEKTEGRCEWETTGFAAPMVKIPVTDETIPWVERYTAKYGVEAINQAADTYEALQVVFQAIKIAGTTDPDVLVKTLEENEFQTLRGKVKFNEAHQHMSWLGPPYKIESPLGGPLGQWQLVEGKPQIVIVWPSPIGDPEKWKPAPWVKVPR
jgi:branched-chain amino acid transport system substrate-binding protein